MDRPRGAVTQLLTSASQGNREAIDKLMSLVHDELHWRAAAYMKGERVEHTLQPSAVVNELYLRLVGEKQAEWKDRSHFLAVASRNMRQILARHARDRNTQKRGGHGERICLGESFGAESGKDVDFLDLEDALTALEEFNARMARIVEMRFFGGLSVDEVAAELEVDPRTIKRDWKVARIFLFDRLAGTND